MGVFLLILAEIALLLELVSLYRPKQLLYMSSRPLVKVTEPDREFQMETVVENRGRMPILFARLIEYLPYKGSRSQKVTSNLYLMPRERVTRRRTLTLSQRGRYFFHGGVLEIGDFLGLTQSQRAFFQTEEVVVLPKPLDKASLSKTMGGLMGDRSVQRFIWEDPMLTIGFNDYTGREPMKKISWTRTAQAGRLMVKTYDVTEDAVVSLVVNTDHGQRLSSDGLMMERLFSTARSIAEELEASGIRYRFITNMRQAGQDYQGSYIPAGAGQSQLFRVLTALGRATYDSAFSFQKLLEKTASYSQMGQRALIVTAAPSSFSAEELSLNGLSAAYGQALGRLQAACGLKPLVAVVDRKGEITWL
ncbi:MAG TPA: hypothetical protein DEP00_02725 [Lachnospiraceae bacterium]|nr:hypothetical protein [Lachnospiraceae bacterium]